MYESCNYLVDECSKTINSITYKITEAPVEPLTYLSIIGGVFVAAGLLTWYFGRNKKKGNIKSTTTE